MFGKMQCQTSSELPLSVSFDLVFFSLTFDHRHDNGNDDHDHDHDHDHDQHNNKEGCEDTGLLR
jgi:ABC-type Zn2+ transport system substrate-binding protein/surface adhesin